MGAPLVGVAPIFALSFMGFGIGKKIQQSHADEVLNLGQVWPLTQFYYLGFLSNIMKGKSETCHWGGYRSLSLIPATSYS